MQLGIVMLLRFRRHLRDKWAWHQVSLGKEWGGGICCDFGRVKIILFVHKKLILVYTTKRKDGVNMSQSNQNKQNNSSSTSMKDKFSNQCNCDGCGCVEPLPESSRPRRDGPGGEDAE